MGHLARSMPDGGLHPPGWPLRLHAPQPSASAEEAGAAQPHPPQCGGRPAVLVGGHRPAPRHGPARDRPEPAWPGTGMSAATRGWVGSGSNLDALIGAIAERIPGLTFAVPHAPLITRRGVKRQSSTLQGSCEITGFLGQNVTASQGSGGGGPANQCRFLFSWQLPARLPC